jgi:hypothetical protein
MPPRMPPHRCHRRLDLPDPRGPTARLDNSDPSDLANPERTTAEAVTSIKNQIKKDHGFVTIVEVRGNHLYLTTSVDGQPDPPQDGPVRFSIQPEHGARRMKGGSGAEYLELSDDFKRVRESLHDLLPVPLLPAASPAASCIGRSQWVASTGAHARSQRR